MDIGSMRQRIILQKHILHTDEIGNHQSHWEKFYSCFAYVNLASGKAFYFLLYSACSASILHFHEIFCFLLLSPNSSILFHYAT